MEESKSAAAATAIHPGFPPFEGCLNCRSGDLAVVTRAPDPYSREFLGHVFTLTHLFRGGRSGRLCWGYEGQRRFVDVNGFLMQVSGFADHILTPIRPGAGVDEMLMKTGRPHWTADDFRRELDISLAEIKNAMHALERAVRS